MTGLLFHLDGLRRGPGAAALTPAWLLLVDGIVAHAGPAIPPDLPPELHLAKGGWAVEPLADGHVHLGLSGSFRRSERERTAALPPEAALERVLGLLEEYRLRGIAAVRDGGEPGGVTLEAARRANSRPERYAALLPCGRPVRREGEYGAFLGTGVKSVAAAKQLLRDQRNLGATHAKILATGLNSLDRAGHVGSHQFSPEDLTEICREAGALGLPPMVHANGPLAGVLGAGPDTVEHGFWLEPLDLEWMAGEGVGWAPTLGAWAALEAHPELTATQGAVVRQTDVRHRDEVYRGWQAGVRILAGSDAGTPGVSHANGLRREIERLAATGLPAPAALATATWASRGLCERALGRRLGSLASGTPAGLVWLDADPVEDPQAWERPLGVHLGGRWSPSAAAASRISQPARQRLLEAKEVR